MMQAHGEEVARRLREGVRRGLEGAGEAGVAAVREAMARRYGEPIRQSGALMESIAWAAEDGRVAVGTNIPYAGLIHNGTSRKAGRPFLTDGLAAGAAEMARRLGEGIAEAME